MLNLLFRHQLIRTSVVLVLSFGLVGCFDLQTDEPSSSVNNAKPSVNKVVLSNNAFVINGSNLQGITSLKIKNNQNSFALKISSQSATQIKAVATNPMSLMAGAAYNLIISKAQADDVVMPITIQVANGSLSPASLGSGGASQGQVLQWDGSAWLPVNLPVSNNGGGNSGSGSSDSGSGPWLYVSGVKVGRVLGAPMVGSGMIQIWDSVDNAIVTYQYAVQTPGNPTKSWSADGGSVVFYYLTSDCSDVPHVTGNAQVPGTGFSSMGKFYRSSTQSDTITAIATRSPYWSGNVQQLSNCLAVGSPTSQTMPQAILIQSPAVPIAFSQSVMQILPQ